MNPLLTVEEAARLLNCTPAAIRRWLSQRRLTPVKLGRLVRFRLEDIEAMAAKGLPGPGQAIQPVGRPRGRRQEAQSTRPGASALSPRAEAVPAPA